MCVLRHRGNRMIRTSSANGSRHLRRGAALPSPCKLLLIFILSCWAPGAILTMTAADSTAAAAGLRFDIRAYTVEGKVLPSADALTAIFARHTGTNLDVGEIVKAAAEVQAEYGRQGSPDVSIAIAPDLVTNDIVKMHVFQGATPQILVFGRRYLASGVEAGAASNLTAAASAKAAPAATTNAGPHITIRGYEVTGNDLLSDNVLQAVLSKYTGTNVSFDDIGKMVKELTSEYRDRGYATVSVVVPEQSITNGILKLNVIEGTLAEIRVTGNRYFSSNNVVRSLPSLQTNIILNSKLFQVELDRANANQDRQISPQIEPGPDPNTTLLRLQVKDRLPLHAKTELNNENSPGTPDLRVNSSAVYNNLWQLEHSLGVQYSFSPEKYKSGSEWNFYDRPLVANYSGFYRLLLGAPEAVSDVVASRPGSFGFDEATRKFRPPPPSGAPELNLYASRSSIDTGVETTSDRFIVNTPGVRSVMERDTQQDITINETAGFRLSGPLLPQMNDWRSTLSAGADFKTYGLTSQKTNSFQFTEVHLLQNGTPTNVVGNDVSPVPRTQRTLRYLPLSLRYDSSLKDSLGFTGFGLGLSANAWHSSSQAAVQAIAGSSRVSGHWVTLTPSLSRDFLIHNWTLSLRADGQWASEPLISNEQFGTGGIASVRGYHEGEVFGDTGWHVSLEQKTPPHIVGQVIDGVPLIIRGSIYMDYAESYLLDPQGRAGHTSLWGVGIGGVASVGSHWEGRFWFSFPLLNAGTIEQYQPFFNFSLTAQF